MERKLKTKILELDDKITKAVEKRQKNLLVQFFEGITSLGSPPVTLVLISLLLIFGFKQTGITMFSGLLVSGITVTAIKRYVGRERPENRVDQFLSRESFPSGHATNAFTTATILLQKFSKPKTFLTLATLVAFSRIYLEDHYLSDTVTGAILGLVIGFVLTAI